MAWYWHAVVSSRRSAWSWRKPPRPPVCGSFRFAVHGSRIRTGGGASWLWRTAYAAGSPTATTSAVTSAGTARRGAGQGATSSAAMQPERAGDEERDVERVRDRRDQRLVGALADLVVGGELARPRSGGAARRRRAAARRAGPARRRPRAATAPGRASPGARSARRGRARRRAPCACSVARSSWWATIGASATSATDDAGVAQGERARRVVRRVLGQELARERGERHPHPEAGGRLRDERPRDARVR